LSSLAAARAEETFREASLAAARAVGLKDALPPEIAVDDDELNGLRKTHAAMLKEVDDLGAGFSVHVAKLREYYSNGEALGDVAASYWSGGARDRRDDWADSGLEMREPSERQRAETTQVEAATVLMRERWAFLNTVTRRSAVAVLVSGALDPLRTLATETRAGVARALELHWARCARDASVGRTIGDQHAA